MSLQSAHAAYQAGRLIEAEEIIGPLMQSASASRAERALAQQLGAMIATHRGDHMSALQRIQQALQHPTNTAERLNTQGNILRAMGYDVQAEQSFAAAVDGQPDYDVARFNLARLQLDSSQYAEAADEFARVLTRAPDHMNAWRGRIEALLESQQLDAASAAIADAPLPEPERGQLRARLAFNRGELDTAQRLAREVATDPARGGHAMALALQILRMTGRWNEAESLITDTLSQHPDRPGLWAAGLRALYKSGDLRASKALLGQAPKGMDVELVRAELLIEQEHFAEAEEAAMAALKDAPGHAPMMQSLCRAALGAGHFETAQQVADHGLRAEPNNQFYYAVKATAGRARGQDYGYYFDYARFVKPYDLSPPDGWPEMAAFNAALKAELDALHGFQDAPLDQTLRLGTQTAADLRYVDSPAIRAFFKAVDPAIRSYVEEIGRDPHHAFLRRNMGGYRIRSAWSVRLGAGGHHVNHIHPEGWISSAYYVDIPPAKGREGWIKFGEPPAPLNRALGQDAELEIEPVPGRLVLFPSYLWHGTNAITGEAGTRLTLPIDILPAAE